MSTNRNMAAANTHEYNADLDHEPGITLSDTIASSGLSLIVEDSPAGERSEDSPGYSTQFALPIYGYRRGHPSQGFMYREAVVEFLDRMHREDVDIFPILPSSGRGRQNSSATSFLNRLMENDLVCSPKLQGVGP
ncbi:MAG: hypothetical protein Q7T74_00370, partial [Candidatus Saccharibacteria bacterium]|nr:hypothetical protein [Candidatus Saccharibacteria bacterium]